ILKVRAMQGKKEKRWISLGLKTIFFAVAFFLIIFTVMANMGGSSDTLRESIEQFISESTGYKARVGHLSAMTFFPDISFNFENMELYGESSAEPAVYTGSVKVALDFWDVMMNTGKIKTFNIRKFRALPGVIFESAFALDELAITDKEEGRAV